MIEETLNSLGLSRDEVKIYMQLLDKGNTTAGRLAQKLGMARPTLYDALQRMHDKGVVTRSLKAGVRTFSAQPPRILSKLFQQRIENLQNQQKQFQAILPQLEQKFGAHLLAQRFQYFEGVEGVQNVLKDMLMYQDMDTFAFWPIKSMVEMLSPDFFRWHNKERIRNNLYTRAIWPEKEVVEIKTHPFLGDGVDFRREIRVAPTQIHFTLGYWCYANKVAFLSSQRESFGFIIESAELATMQRAQFDVVWGMSKKLVIDPKDTAGFVKEINTPKK